MKKYLSLLLAIMLICSLNVVALAEQDTGEVVISMDANPSAVGETVTVQVAVESISSHLFYAADVELYYNPTVLKCVEKPVMSTELAESGIMTRVYDKVDNEKGLVRYAIGMKPEEYKKEGWQVASGNLNLFTVAFEVIGEGDVNLQIASKETAPAYEETFPAGAKMFLGSSSKLAELSYQKLSYVIGEKGKALISEILPIDSIQVPYGTESIDSFLPTSVSVKLDDGSVKDFGMKWSPFMSSYDGNTPGTYLFRGELQIEEGYLNHMGLFSLLEVTVLPGDGSAETEKDDQNSENTGTTIPDTDKTDKNEPTQPEQPPVSEDNNQEQEDSKITFTDLDSVSWAADKIIALANAGVVSGVSEGIYSPNGEVTRAQFVAMLTRAFGLLDETAVSDFSDISEGQWYYSAVASAKKCGITAGYEDNTFRPDALITRQEMAAMAYRTAQIAGLTIPDTTDKLIFTDEDQIADYAKDAISAMQMGGVINGMGDGRFGPAENATRAQAAVIIYQLYQLK